jgi:hypothetical protein
LPIDKRGKICYNNPITLAHTIYRIIIDKEAEHYEKIERTEKEKNRTHGGKR